MKYLIIDGMLNGTGIRDKYNGGYLYPEDLNLNASTVELLNKWLVEYEIEYYKEYNDAIKINVLDSKGIEIANIIKVELNCKVEYYSDALMTRILI
jgi:hypothetical protein